MKTPGVYQVEDISNLHSVEEASTAIPAFIGYTEKSFNDNKLLLYKPWKIHSLEEYHTYFGGAPTPSFSLQEKETGENGEGGAFLIDNKAYVLKRADTFTFYYHLRLFFANGGRACYIVSIGDYTSPAINREKLMNGIRLLLLEPEPSLVVIPEAVQLPAADCYAMQQAMLVHCGEKTRSCFAILDVPGGDKPRNHPSGDCINAFREGIGSQYLDYGATYYPWLNTTVVTADEVRLDYINNLDLYQPGDLPQEELLTEMRCQLNLLPPSAAMAGIYAMVDSTKGVWKAPANMCVAACVSPAVDLTATQQEDLNVPADGKSVNAIRTITGQGIRVWGARTLDGNSLDWRYINVRRTMIMIEQSIQHATQTYTGEPNDANTWVSIKALLNNFLNGLWKRGALAGAIPGDAYSVCVGLGETMTPEDILEGLLRVTALVALVRPAEFIEITFQLQMQQN